MTGRKFAEGTSVSPEKTRGEIETTLARFGATGFAYAYQNMPDGAQRAQVEFLAAGRRVRFVLHLPAPARFTRPRRGANWMNEPAPDKHAAEVRRLWRALLLGIKAKLELARDGISTFEEEFLAHIVVPGTNRTVGEHALPALEEAYATGRAVALLPGAAE